MSDPADTFVTISQASARGMITLRGDLDSTNVARALLAVIGTAMPARRKVTGTSESGAVWMSSDELLLLTPYDHAEKKASDMRHALAGEFATLANVSDARAVFTMTGPDWREALAKLCPVDFSRFGPGDIRRTRAAQIAAAIWMDVPDSVTLVTFRSVGDHALTLLQDAARQGSAPGLYRRDQG